MKIGIIGTGKIAEIHTANSIEIPGVTVAVVGSEDETRARIFAERFGISSWEASHGGVFKHNLDAVLICSTAETHCTLIEQAADAKTHVFCEKPIGIELGSIKRALAHTKDAGILVQVGFNRRFDPNFSALKERITERNVPLEQVRIVSRDPEAPSAENLTEPLSLISETMVHDLDMAQYLGGEVVSVSVVGGALINPAFTKNEQIDTAAALLRFASGATGVIENSWRSTDGYDQRIEVHTSRGTYYVLNPSSASFKEEEGVWSLTRPIAGFFSERYDKSYRREIQSFVEALETGTLRGATGEDAFYTARLVEAVKQSYRLGGTNVSVAKMVSG